MVEVTDFNIDEIWTGDEFMMREAVRRHLYNQMVKILEAGPVDEIALKRLDAISILLLRMKNGAE